MKRYSELTEAEKRELTTEQINSFVEVECMVVGVKIEPRPTEPVRGQ